MDHQLKRFIVGARKPADKSSRVEHVATQEVLSVVRTINGRKTKKIIYQARWRDRGTIMVDFLKRICRVWRFLDRVNQISQNLIIKQNRNVLIHFV